MSKNNKRVLDKQSKLNAIKESLTDCDEQQLQEIDEMMTSAELEQLKKHRKNMIKTGLAQIQVCESLLVYNNFIHAGSNVPKHNY